MVFLAHNGSPFLHGQKEEGDFSGSDWAKPGHFCQEAEMMAATLKSVHHMEWVVAIHFCLPHVQQITIDQTHTHTFTKDKY